MVIADLYRLYVVVPQSDFLLNIQSTLLVLILIIMRYSTSSTQGMPGTTAVSLNIISDLFNISINVVPIYRGKLVYYSGFTAQQSLRSARSGI